MIFLARQIKDASKVSIYARCFIKHAMRGVLRFTHCDAVKQARYTSSVLLRDMLQGILPEKALLRKGHYSQAEVLSQSLLARHCFNKYRHNYVLERRILVHIARV